MLSPNDTAPPERAGDSRQAAPAFLVGCRRFAARLSPFAKLGRAAKVRLETVAWARRLDEEKASLVALVCDTETEFLATGEGLKGLARQLTDIQKECLSLTDLTLGQMQDAAVQFAFQLLKKAEDLVLASYEQYDLVFATFSELQQRLVQLRKQHDKLMSVLAPLDFLAIAFRIEASRHPEEVRAVFYALAADVTRTVKEVRGTLELQFEGLGASERIARNFVEQISVSVQQHRSEVAVTLKASRNQLHAMNAAFTSSGAGATDLTERNQAVMRHIGGIVMAQQCQDITRQKIEHVGEAMDEMRAHLVAVQPATFASDADMRQFIFRAGQIQLQQVQAVFEELNRAAASIQSGIQGLHSDAGAAAEVAVKVGAATLDTKVAGLCQASIGEVLGIATQVVQKITEILAAFEPLRARFINCTDKASELALNVRHDALNAQVFSIQAADGATLEVLAGRMRVIADETVAHVEEFGGELGQTADMVNNLCQRLVDFQQMGKTEREILAGESVLSREKLTKLEEAIPALIGLITQQQAVFARSAEEILAHVRFPETVAGSSSRSLGFFKDLVAWGGRGGLGLAGETATSKKIDLLKSRYTMASERHAHTAVLQPVSTSAEVATPLSSVELFDDLGSPPTAVVEVPGEGATQGNQSVGQPPLVELSAGETCPAKPAPPPSVPKPAAPDLGDNVELF